MGVMHRMRKKGYDTEKLLIEVQRPAGADLMREGEIGREFAVIRKGEVTVSVDGVERGRLGPGDFFGELALLPAVTGSDGKRQATVTATSDVELAVCGRYAFRSLMESNPEMGDRIAAQAATLSV